VPKELVTSTKEKTKEKNASTLSRETASQTCPTYACEVVFVEGFKHARVVAFAELVGGALVAVVGRLDPAGDSLRSQTLRLRDAAPDAPLRSVPIELVGRKVRATPFEVDDTAVPPSFCVSTGFLP
jgi:hypothetical protein